MEKSKIIQLLQSTGKSHDNLIKKAEAIRIKSVGKNVYFRGLIEFSNICENDCYYCGIRKSNSQVKRYIMTKEEIMECVRYSYNAGYGSIVLQSGESHSKKYIDFVVDVLQKIRSKYKDIGITLSVGEHDKDTYKHFFDAGADKYLLRIESSSETHYNKLHPKDMVFKKRLQCLKDLREIGYHVGTGVMIMSPYQRFENLADDILFFKAIDADMIGMGPFIFHDGTPFGSSKKKNDFFPHFFSDKNKKYDSLTVALNMIAVLRIMMPDINIAAATSLQAINSFGREMGIKAGANVIMPLVTPGKYRKEYQLYDGKPCLDDSADDCKNCITQRIKRVGYVPAFFERGDSLHISNKKDKVYI